MLFEYGLLGCPKRQAVGGVRRKVVFVGMDEQHGFVAAGEEEFCILNEAVGMGEVIVEMLIFRGREAFKRLEMGDFDRREIIGQEGLQPDALQHIRQDDGYLFVVMHSSGLCTEFFHCVNHWFQDSVTNAVVLFDVFF